MMTGHVFDQQTSESLPGANVFISHEDGSKKTNAQGFVTGTATDSFGAFALEDVRAGEFVSISFIGYETQTVQYTPFIGHYNFHLVPVAYQLQEVIITPDEPRRKTPWLVYAAVGFGVLSVGALVTKVLKR